MDEIIRAELARDGVIPTWRGLLVPVLTGIGIRYEQTGTCVEAEHLLSSVTLAALATLHPYAAGPADDRPVLLACAEGEQHSLPLYALAAALAECAVSARMLGAALPSVSLVAAVRRTGRPRCSSGRRSRAPGTRPPCRTCGPGGPGPGCCSAAQAGRRTACRMAAA